MANEINVIDLYNTINTLAKIYHAGYESADDFNNKLRSVEIAFLNMFHAWDEDDQAITDHEAPFRVHTRLTADADGIVQLPDNYAFKSAVLGVLVENPCEGEVGIQTTLFPADQLRSDEVGIKLWDPIAKPSMEENRFYYTFRNQAVQLFPKELKGIDITYLRYPVYGNLVMTYSTVDGEDIETPNVTESRNLEWKLITFEYFKYAMLFLLGVELKESALINASQMQKIASVFKYR